LKRSSASRRNETHKTYETYKTHMNIQDLLNTVIQRGASDLHLLAGVPPVLRIDGELERIAAQPVCTPEEIEEAIFSLVTPAQKELIVTNHELDFSLAFGDQARFRINVYFQKGALAAEFRVIPLVIKSIEELNLPKICHDLTKLRQGFVLVTGPVGHGKSTTLAAIINEITQNRAAHIVTIEDPIEFVFPAGKAIVSQREVHADTYSWEKALRSVLREDPDVVFIGEMRDLETISSALTIAETGHLVFSTLHTNSASQTIDRIIDVFPEYTKAQVRMQVASTLEAVLSQRLVPTLGGGRIPAVEIMLGSPAIKTAIREGKTQMIDNIIQTSTELGMVTLETALAELVKTGKIALETAQEFALRAEEVLRQVRRK